MSLPFQVTLATYVHGGSRGPAGWAAVVRQGDRTATYQGHACNATRAEVEDQARALMVSSLGNRMHFFTKVDGPLTETGRRDVAEAERLARQSAVVVGIFKSMGQ